MKVARRIVPAVALVVALGGAAAGTGAQAAEPVPAGTWTFVPEHSERIDRAIDQAVSHMNFVVRGIARSRLRGANKPVERIVVQYPDGNLFVSMRADEPPIITSRSGVTPYTRADGEVVQVTTELQDRAIRHFFDSDDGQKEHVYRLRPDGMLALEVTVLSDRLREPFRYTWVFRRQ